MKFLREDNQPCVTISVGMVHPVDKNDPEHEGSAIEYTLPEGFSEKAKKSWDYFDGYDERWDLRAIHVFEYKGQLVVTDESLYLTEHGNGTYEAPAGGPHIVCDSWDELETWLEAVYDDLDFPPSPDADLLSASPATDESR